MALFDNTSFRIAEQGLDLLVKQQQIIAQNIANVDTPEYKAKYLYFAGVLKETMDEKSASVSEAVKKKRLELASVIHTDETTKDQPDGNNVDSDTQSALFAKNALQYQALINQINAEFTMMRAAMRKS
ncbi:MAG: flagellar basal body rod protein FlgB [Ruminiclostridium sp.]|nr:flagellar basal body rod protein FlgB [Ruminiclostridium sp.]